MTSKEALQGLFYLDTLNDIKNVTVPPAFQVARFMSNDSFGVIDSFLSLFVKKARGKAST